MFSEASIHWQMRVAGDRQGREAMIPPIQQECKGLAVTSDFEDQDFGPRLCKVTRFQCPDGLKHKWKNQTVKSLGFGMEPYLVPQLAYSLTYDLCQVT